MLNGKRVTNGVTNGVTWHSKDLARRLAKAEKDRQRQRRHRAKLKIAKILSHPQVRGHGYGIIGCSDWRHFMLRGCDAPPPPESVRFYEPPPPVKRSTADRINRAFAKLADREAA